MSDPYQMTLGPDVGHHFDYWRDADAANGKPLTSAQYAAAWLTYLAQQAKDGKPVDTTAKPTAVELAAAVDAYMADDAAEGDVAAEGTDNQAPAGTTGSTDSVTAPGTSPDAPVAGSVSETSGAVATPSESVVPTTAAAVTSAPTSETASSSAAATTTTTVTSTTTTTKAPTTGQ